jgi:hypothetical protein
MREAMRPMMMTTIRISMRVKPLHSGFFLCLIRDVHEKTAFCQTKPPNSRGPFPGKAGSVFPPCLFHPPGQGKEINASFHTILLKAFYDHSMDSFHYKITYPENYKDNPDF